MDEVILKQNQSLEAREKDVQSLRDKLEAKTEIINTRTKELDQSQQELMI